MSCVYTCLVDLTGWLSSNRRFQCGRWTDVRCARGVGTTSVHQCAVKMLSFFFLFFSRSRERCARAQLVFLFVSLGFVLYYVGGWRWLVKWDRLVIRTDWWVVSVFSYFLSFATVHFLHRRRTDIISCLGGWCLVHLLHDASTLCRFCGWKGNAETSLCVWFKYYIINDQPEDRKCIFFFFFQIIWW